MKTVKIIQALKSHVEMGKLKNIDMVESHNSDISFNIHCTSFVANCRSF